MCDLHRVPPVQGAHKGWTQPMSAIHLAKNGLVHTIKLPYALHGPLLGALLIVDSDLSNDTLVF